MEAFFLGLMTLLFGAIVGLAGYQLSRVLLPIWGFVAGFVWGAHLVDIFIGGGFLATLAGWVVGVVLGLAGALLAYAFYQAAVAIMAGIVGFYLAYGIMLQVGAQEGTLTSLIALLTAAAVASIVVYFRVPKALLIILTSFAGATAVLGGVLVMSGQIAPDSLGTRVVGDIVNGSMMWSAVWVILAVLGIASQVLLDRSLQQQWESGYALSDRGMAGALGGEVERENNADDYNRFEDDEVETVDEFRRRRIAEGETDKSRDQS